MLFENFGKQYEKESKLAVIRNGFYFRIFCFETQSVKVLCSGASRLVVRNKWFCI